MAQLILPRGYRAQRLEARCPGATLLDGAAGEVVSVCGPLKRERDLEPPSQKGDPMNVAFSTRDDARTVVGFCCDRYSQCLVWRAEQERIALGVESLQDVPALRSESA